MCLTWLDKNLRLSDVFKTYYSTWKFAPGASRQPMPYVLADQSFRKSTATLCFYWLKTSVSGKHVDISLALLYYLYQWPNGSAQIQSNLCLHNQWFLTYESVKVLFCIVYTIVKLYDICSPKNWSSDNRKKCHLQQHLISWNTHILLVWAIKPNYKEWIATNNQIFFQHKNHKDDKNNKQFEKKKFLTTFKIFLTGFYCLCYYQVLWQHGKFFT